MTPEEIQESAYAQTFVMQEHEKERLKAEIESLKAYMKRLEDAFIKLYCMNLQDMQKEIKEKHAQDALAKLKEMK